MTCLILTVLGYSNQQSKFVICLCFSLICIGEWSYEETYDNLHMSGLSMKVILNELTKNQQICPVQSSRSDYAHSIGLQLPS